MLDQIHLSILKIRRKKTLTNSYELSCKQILELKGLKHVLSLIIFEYLSSFSTFNYIVAVLFSPGTLQRKYGLAF